MPFVSPDQTRATFSRAMSEMYQKEVPLYGDLMSLVGEVNRQCLEQQPTLAQSLARTGEIERLDAERHGAIRVGTATELATIARLFAVMGMQPVGYYDLTLAGVPVHSTAFRAVHEQSLQVSPFRVFTSLLRLELIDDTALRELAAQLLEQRQIFTQDCLALIDRFERDGGLDQADSDAFVEQALVAAREFTAFNGDNDPHHEHDFGTVEIEGRQVFWKIDYFDPTMTQGSEDPSSLALTRRVLTVMLAEDY